MQNKLGKTPLLAARADVSPAIVAFLSAEVEKLAQEAGVVVQSLSQSPK